MSEHMQGKSNRAGKATTMHRTIIETTLSKFVDLDDFTDECVSALAEAYFRADENKQPTFGMTDIAKIILQASYERPEILAAGGPGAEQMLDAFIKNHASETDEALEASPRIDRAVTGFIMNCHTAAAAMSEPVSLKDMADAFMIHVSETSAFSMIPAENFEEIPDELLHQQSADGEAPTVLEHDRKGPAYCQCLNETAIPAIARDREIDDLIHALTLRTKSSVCLVGPSGVGKSRIIEGLASRVRDGDVPVIAKYWKIWRLDLTALMGGTQMRGELEDRLSKLMKHFEKHKTDILLIEDYQPSLKPLFANPEIKVIITVSETEWRKQIIGDPSLARCFRRISIEEMSSGSTHQVLETVAAELSAHHGVAYSSDAINAAVAIPKRFIQRRPQPDIGIEVLDEAGARKAVTLAPGTGQNLNLPEVSENDIRRVVSSMTGIPIEKLGSSDKAFLADLPKRLASKVVGQDEAIARVCAAYKRARSGVIDRTGPEGNFLFIGPTGCGKTSLAQALATLSGRKLLRFDMSEYVEQHSVSRLIGAPPGYVGYDRGGLLTDAIEKHPNAILLLDEIEKAHSSIFALLLQVMDAGRITDSRGETVDFRNVLLIMSTNAGMEKFHNDRARVGFSQPSEPSEIEYDRNTINNTFAAEFRNRLDAEIFFNPIGLDIMPDVVRSALDEVRSRLTLEHISIDVNESAIGWLAKNGFDPRKGARPLKRLLNDLIVDEIAAHYIESGSDRFALKVFTEGNELKKEIL